MLGRERWELVLSAFVEHGENFTLVAKKTGVSIETATRAWSTGWERPFWAKTPIKDRVEEERLATRAELAKKHIGLEQEKKRELMRLDAAQERAREAEAIRAELSTSLMMFASLSAFSKVTYEAAQHVAGQIAAEIRTGTLTWREGLNFLVKVSKLSLDVSNQFGSTMKDLRLHIGDPQQILQLNTNMKAVDESVFETMDEERLRAAVIALAQGEITEDGQRLIQFQAERQGSAN